MANALYPTGKEGLLDGSWNWNDTIKVALVRGYTYSSTHKFLSPDITSAGTVVATLTLIGKSSTLGVADAADDNFAAVASGPAAQALVFYKDTGSAATSRLVLFVDTATGLPVTPNGSIITVTFDPGANKIFALN